jgi:hypothetical protein
MATYIIKWEMVYEDSQNEFDAVAQAYAHLCELAQDPSAGANYVQVTNLDTPSSYTHVALDEALAFHELLNQ